ncbi:MAG TPA: hypothetical protein VIL13_12135 [Longimicrobiales bacterium]|jgi:hypothetical protein
MWRRIQADGCEWEVRVIANDTADRPDRNPRDHEVLEFRPLDGRRRPRRIIVPAGALEAMDDAALLSAYRRARPGGGDYYGRPGKPMSDVVW